MYYNCGFRLPFVASLKEDDGFNIMNQIAIECI